MDSLRLRTTLDAYYRQVESTILVRQHPVSGLLPASTAVTNHGDYRDAWVRDNVYSILAVWGLGLAYRQLDDDGGRRYELEHRTVKLMRGLLRSMMAQSAKVEAFKKSRHPADSLHAKYDTETGGTAVGDMEWGHLQIDATSIYLLVLVQMIASGLDIIWDASEVNFIQNLVYYIERAYRTPDYGIWERGAKSNRGSVELNASSIGMAKAALEALAGFDLFGARGSQRSVVHVSPDNIAQANITLKSMLPRESHSKETDAAILSIIGYPAYAISNRKLVDKVKKEVVTKLEGRYGLKRFLRDGHQTVVEDEGRLHYEDAELERFAHIESEWPLFFCYLYLDAIIQGDTRAIEHYGGRLQSVLVEQNGQQLLPELYYVPAECVAAEKALPGSQKRLPNDNVPLVWAQSLYFLANMMRDGVIDASDIDPLGRRRLKVPRRPVVQLVFLAQDQALQAELAAHGVLTETKEDIAPVVVCHPQDISAAYGQVGRNDRLGLTGRSARVLKTLTTSRIYRLRSETVLCLASFFSQEEFFLAWDVDFLLRRFNSELVYLHRNWTEPGRPTVTVLLTHDLLDANRESFYAFMHQVASGKVGSVPVRRGRVAELMPTASFERISDLHDLALPVTPVRELGEDTKVLAHSGKHQLLDSVAEQSIELANDIGPLVERLGVSDNLYEQIELLAAVARIGSLSTPISVHGVCRSVAELVEEVYEQAGHLRLWAVVRRAAGLLGKVDGDLTLACSAILVRQKYIQVGRAYSDDSLITQPLLERELLAKINEFCREDVRDRVLTQELMLYVSLLIKAHPELFRELLTIRLGQLIVLLTSELARERDLTADDAYEALMHLPPSEVQHRLEKVLAAWNSIEDLPQQQEQLDAQSQHGALSWKPDLGLEKLEVPEKGWLAWRQHHGVIGRRPQDFYAKVWAVLQHTPCLIIGDRLERRNRLESRIVLSDMTPGEQSFALLLEHLLNKAPSPEYRQITVEALSVLESFFSQNPSLQVNDALALDALLGHAVRLLYVGQHPEHEPSYNDHKPQAWDAFYAAAPAETTAAIVTALRLLLSVRPAESALGASQVS